MRCADLHKLGRGSENRCKKDSCTKNTIIPNVPCGGDSVNGWFSNSCFSFDDTKY